METARVLWIVGLVLLDWGVAVGQLLPPASDEVKLRVTQQELDEDAAGRVQKTHAQTMAAQFNVESKIVEALRMTKHSWGEIAVRLGSAQELTRADPKTYPVMTGALEKIGELRAQHLSWSEIAKTLGFTLGPVVNEVQRVRQEMRARAKKEATEGVVTPGQPHR